MKKLRTIKRVEKPGSKKTVKKTPEKPQKAEKRPMTSFLAEIMLEIPKKGESLNKIHEKLIKNYGREVSKGFMKHMINFSTFLGIFTIKGDKIYPC